MASVADIKIRIPEDAPNPYQSLIDAKNARDRAHAAAKAATDLLREEALASGLEPGQLRQVLGLRKWQQAKDLLDAAEGGQLVKRYAWAKKAKADDEPAEGAKPFSGLITVGYVDEDGNPARLAA